MERQTRNFSHKRLMYVMGCGDGGRFRLGFRGREEQIGKMGYLCRMGQYGAAASTGGNDWSATRLLDPFLLPGQGKIWADESDRSTLPAAKGSLFLMAHW